MEKENNKDITDHYLELLIRSFSDDLSEQEILELERLRLEYPDLCDNDSDYWDIFNNIKKDGAEFKMPDIDKCWKDFENKISQNKNTVRTLFSVVISIAAMVICFIYYSNNKMDVNIDSQTITQTIKTGDKKAVLYLADGERVEVGKYDFEIISSSANIRNDSIGRLSYKEINHRGKKSPEINKLVVNRGGEYFVTLSDGTKVWLNSESELVFPVIFNEDRRIVRLKGEGYFEVAKDSLRQFIVCTNDIQVKVLGTSFNVSVYNNDSISSITLVEGKVETFDENNHLMATLTPSFQLQYTKHTAKINVVKVDPRVSTNWKNGIYIFQNATLEEILKRMQRWYDFNYTCQDPDLLKLRFTGEIDKNKSIEFALKLISFTTAVHFSIAGENIEIIK